MTDRLYHVNTRKYVLLKKPATFSYYKNLMETILAKLSKLYFQEIEREGDKKYVITIDFSYHK